MDFLDVWGMKGWTAYEALTVAVEAVERNGRVQSFADWAEESGDVWAVIAEHEWTDDEAIAAILAYADDAGFERQLSAHARRVARRQAPDPDHYGD